MVQILQSLQQMWPRFRRHHEASLQELRISCCEKRHTLSFVWIAPTSSTGPKRNIDPLTQDCNRTLSEACGRCAPAPKRPIMGSAGVDSTTLFAPENGPLAQRGHTLAHTPGARRRPRLRRRYVPRDTCCDDSFLPLQDEARSPRPKQEAGGIPQRSPQALENGPRAQVGRTCEPVLARLNDRSAPPSMAHWEPIR